MEVGSALIGARARIVLGRVLRGALLLNPGPPVRAGGRVGDLRRLLPVVALVGHEVLEDHLLDVTVLGVQRRERLQ